MRNEFVARMKSGIGLRADAHPGLHPGYEYRLSFVIRVMNS